MKQRKERELANLSAYRDGELSLKDRARVRDELETDSELSRELRQLNALGSALRDNWTEGPPAPSAQLMLNAMRADLDEIDALRAERSPFTRIANWFQEQFRPVPMTALAGACAAAVLIVYVSLPQLGLNSPDSQDHPVLTSFGSPGAIYDFQEEIPLLVFEALDGETVIWKLEEVEDEGLRSALFRRGSVA